MFDRENFVFFLWLNVCYMYVECVLCVLISRKLLEMSSKRFYTAEEVTAILVDDILSWHENRSDVRDDS